MSLKRSLFLAASVLTVAVIVTPAAAADCKMIKPTVPGVAGSEILVTSIGLLRLEDGLPTACKADKLHDNLDQSRALQA